MTPFNKLLLKASRYKTMKNLMFLQTAAVDFQQAAM